MLAYPASVPLPVITPSDTYTEYAVDRLLKASHAHSFASVAVAGPLAGAAMSALWRRGFNHVEAARRVTCPCADQMSELLLIIGCTGADQASAVLTALLPILDSGGVLAIDASQFSSPGERLKLCQMLANRGLRHSESAHHETEIVAHKPEPLPGFAIAS